MIALDHRDGQAAVQGRNGDARAHRAAAHHPKAVEGARFCAAGFGNFGTGALGKKGMNHTFRLLRGEAFEKAIAFEQAPIGERLGDAGAQAFDNLERGHLPAHAAVGRLFGICQRRFEGGFVCEA